MIQTPVFFIKSKSESYALFPKLSDEETYTQCSTIQNALILKPTFELYHSFLHTQVSDMSHIHNHLSLRHMQHFNVILKHYKQKIDLKLLQDITSKREVTKIWQSYLVIQNDFFDLKEPFEIPNNSYTKKVLHKVKYKLQNPNSSYLQFLSFITMSIHAFNYRNLQRNYNFTCKLFIPFLIPHRIFKLILEYSTDKKKRQETLSQVNRLSS